MSTRKRAKSKKWSRAQEREYVGALIERIVREYPRRQPTSEQEREAQQLMRAEFENIGLAVDEHAFEFNDNLYKNIALHFGLGTLGTVVSGIAPLAGLALHGLAASSYWADSTRRGYVLRRLFPFKPSQNILATIPAEGEPDLRLVFMAHIDAAFTGWLFQPETVKRFSGDLPPRLKFIKRSMAFATQTQAALAGFDLLRVFLGPLTWPLRPLEAALTIPAALAFALNMEVVLRNEIVPGANDDLSGVAALPILAQRLASKKPKNVELVFAVTGCEEASLGGGDALARDMEGVWDKDRTVVIGLDGLAQGDLFFMEVEGEVVQTPIPAWLGDTCREVSASEPRFAGVEGFEIPVGGTDVAAWLARGWEGVCLGCVDPELGAPRDYHVPTDVPENLDVEDIMLAIDYAEKLAEAVIARKS